MHGSAHSLAGAELHPPSYPFKSAEEKALFNQAHVRTRIPNATGTRRDRATRAPSMPTELAMRTDPACTLA